MKKLILLIGFVLLTNCKEKEITEKNVPEKVKKEIGEKYLEKILASNKKRYYDFKAKIQNKNGKDILYISGILKLDKPGFILRPSSKGNSAILLNNNKLIFYIYNGKGDLAISGNEDNLINFSIDVTGKNLKDKDELCVFFYNDDDPNEDLLRCFEPYIKCESNIDIKTPKQLGGGTTVGITPYP